MILSVLDVTNSLKIGPSNLEAPCSLNQGRQAPTPLKAVLIPPGV